VRVLSIDGGGYLGLAAAAFIREAERHFKTRAAERFDFFCGTSTGAIIALGLSQGMSAEEIVTLYERLGPNVFPPRYGFLMWLRELVSARYDNAALKTALADAFGDRTLDDVKRRGKSVLVAAYNATDGRPKIFKTDHAPHLTAHGQYRLRDVALASAAAPTFLPMVPLKNPVSGTTEVFCDGGLFANAPALLGYAEVICDFARPPTSVSVLSLATPRSDHSEHTSALGRITQPRLNRGKLQWMKVHELMIDATSAITHTALERLTRASGSRYERFEFARPKGLEMDLVTASTTETLLQLGCSLAIQADARKRLELFFREDNYGERSAAV
jgi:predicted acylesterase/phospholipase RssA